MSRTASSVPIISLPLRCVLGIRLLFSVGAGGMCSAGLEAHRVEHDWTQSELYLLTNEGNHFNGRAQLPGIAALNAFLLCGPPMFHSHWFWIYCRVVIHNSALVSIQKKHWSGESEAESDERKWIWCFSSCTYIYRLCVSQIDDQVGFVNKSCRFESTSLHLQTFSKASSLCGLNEHIICCFVRNQVVHTLVTSYWSFSHFGQNSVPHPIISSSPKTSRHPISLRLPHHAHSIIRP